jgi:hypothetical protein
MCFVWFYLGVCFQICDVKHHKKGFEFRPEAKRIL